METAELIDLVTKNHAAVVKQHEETQKGLAEIPGIQSQLTEMQQKMARRPGLAGAVSGDEVKSWGQQIVESPQFEAFRQDGSAPKKIEVKTVSTIGSGGALAGPMIVPDNRQDILQVLPKRRLTIRNLIAPGQTGGNMIYFPRMIARQNNAAVVAESAAKPQSDFAMEQASAPVRTIAHFMQVSRQAFDDAPALASLIDSELRYGLSLTEETELLSGDGTGQHLLGLIPSATAYSAAFSIAGETMVDRLAMGMLQAELALLPANGFIVNPTDWTRAKLLKTATGEYLLGEPTASGPPILWGLPVIATPAMPAGYFMCGAFDAAAQIFDRMAVEVLISTEHGSNFTNNEITVRCEERLALAIKRSAALIYGSLPA